jgi:hypothetical protein
MEELYIGCAATVFFGTMLSLIFGFFAYLRYLRYREIIALAEKGLVAPSFQHNGKGTLRWGIVLAALGIALCIGLYPIGWAAAPGMFPLNFGPWMLLGLAPVFFGLALILIYVLTSKKTEKAPGIDVIPASEETIE